VPGLGHVPPKCGLSYGIWSTPVVDVNTRTKASIGFTNCANRFIRGSPVSNR
jgi:hypothetical protein